MKNFSNISTHFIDKYKNFIEDLLVIEPVELYYIFENKYFKCDSKEKLLEVDDEYTEKLRDIGITSKSVSAGKYLPQLNAIFINLENLIDPLTILLIISHELRHSYQNECINKKLFEFESKATIKTWNNNFKNYISYNENELFNYEMQPVELDANAFTCHIMMNVFSLKTDVLSRYGNRKSFKSKLLNMKKDFPLSEIIEALEDNEINEKEINEILSNSIERKSM